MLALVGLFGALLAGMMVDVSPGPDADEEGDAPSDGIGAESGKDGAVTPLDQVDTGADGSGGGAAGDNGASDNGAGNNAADGGDDGAVHSSDEPDVPAENLWLQGGDLADALNGDAGSDVIDGGGGGDLICGDAGDDSITAGDGNDVVHAGEGDDRVWGDAGNDSLHGEDGADHLDGGAGNDALFGHEGDDTLDGGAGDDALAGGGGDDLVLGGAGDDALAGGYGNDTVSGGDGADTVDGSDGDDELWGATDGERDQSVDFLNGGSGDDTLWLGAGDYGHGGAGADILNLVDFGAGDPPMQICDFDPAEDHLVVLYDAQLHPDPMLTVEQSESGDTTLLIDGVPLANLTNGANLDLSQITLRAA